MSTAIKPRTNATASRWRALFSQNTAVALTYSLFGGFVERSLERFDELFEEDVMDEEMAKAFARARSDSKYASPNITLRPIINE